MTMVIDAELVNGPPRARDGEGEAVRAFVAQASTEELVDVAYATVDSPIGPLLVARTAAGLVRVAFSGEDRDPVLGELATRLSPRVLEAPGRLDGIRRQLEEYFAGDRTAFAIDIDWSLASGFRRLVLQALFAEVGFGQTVSYRELAGRAGSPRASRAVGSAMATNPVPVVVPCHRVLRSGGALGGYGGGVDVKRRLLALEGALPA